MGFEARIGSRDITSVKGNYRFHTMRQMAFNGNKMRGELSIYQMVAATFVCICDEQIAGLTSVCFQSD